MPGVPDTLVQEFVALFALFRPSQNEQIGGYSYCDDTCSSPGQPINPRTFDDRRPVGRPAYLFWFALFQACGGGSCESLRPLSPSVRMVRLIFVVR